MSNICKKLNLCMMITSALIGQSFATASTSDADLDLLGTKRPQLLVSVSSEVSDGSDSSLRTPGGSKVNRSLSPRIEDVAKAFFDGAMAAFAANDLKQSVEQLKQSVALQYPPAQVLFASFCQSGKHSDCGIPKDEDLALNMLRSAMNQGNSDALFGLGEMYQQGSCGIKPDSSRALDYYRVACLWQKREADKLNRILSGNEPAKILYYSAMELLRDDKTEEGIRLLKTSSYMECPEAQVELGFLHQNALYGLKSDLDLAIRLYERASDKGYAKAFNMLGHLCENSLYGGNNGHNHALLYHKLAYVLGSRMVKEQRRVDLQGLMPKASDFVS